MSPDGWHDAFNKFPQLSTPLNDEYCYFFPVFFSFAKMSNCFRDILKFDWLPLTECLSRTFCLKRLVVKGMVDHPSCILCPSALAWFLHGVNIHDLAIYFFSFALLKTLCFWFISQMEIPAWANNTLPVSFCKCKLKNSTLYASCYIQSFMLQHLCLESWTWPSSMCAVVVSCSCLQFQHTM